MAKDGNRQPFGRRPGMDGYQYTDTMYHLPGSQRHHLRPGDSNCTTIGIASQRCGHVRDGGRSTARGNLSRGSGFVHGNLEQSHVCANPWNGWNVNPVSFVAPPIGSSGVQLYTVPLPALPVGWATVFLAMLLAVVARFAHPEKGQMKRRRGIFDSSPTMRFARAGSQYVVFLNGRQGQTAPAWMAAFRMRAIDSRRLPTGDAIHSTGPGLLTLAFQAPNHVAWKRPNHRRRGSAKVMARGASKTLVDEHQKLFNEIPSCAIPVAIRSRETNGSSPRR